MSGKNNDWGNNVKKNHPTVSIYMPCYNHGEYVRQSIESVLNQTYQDFEFIIVENGSTDHSREIIKEYEVHEQIKVVYFDENNLVKAGEEFNRRFTGDYVAYIYSDDIWMPDKLEKQMEFLQNNQQYAACFSWAEYGDEELHTMNDHTYTIFKQENKTPEEWLKHFWIAGNNLCAPSAVISKEVYIETIKMNQVYWQMPDLFQWINLLIGGNAFYICKDVLVKMRKHIKSISFSDGASRRSANEMNSLREYIFENVPDEMYKTAFADVLIRPEAQGTDELMCEKILFMLAVSEGSIQLQPTALSFFYRHYGSVIHTMRDVYGLDRKDFADKMANLGIDVYEGNYFLGTASNIHRNSDELTGMIDSMIQAYAKIIEMIKGTMQIPMELRESLCKMSDIIETIRDQISELFEIISQEEWESYNLSLKNGSCQVMDILSMVIRIKVCLECIK